MQSIIKRNIHSERKQNLNYIIEAAKKYMYHKRFMLGKNYDKKWFKFDSKMYDILHTENCELYEYLEDTIEGNITKLTTRSLSPVSQYSLSFEDLYDRWLDKGNTGNFDYFLDVILNEGVTVQKNDW